MKEIPIPIDLLEFAHMPSFVCPLGLICPMWLSSKVRADHRLRVHYTEINFDQSMMVRVLYLIQPIPYRQQLETGGCRRSVSAVHLSDRWLFCTYTPVNNYHCPVFFQSNLWQVQTLWTWNSLLYYLRWATIMLPSTRYHWVVAVLQSQ